MLEEIIEVLSKIDEKKIDKFVELLTLNTKNSRIYIAGNGGSASTASHFASDLASFGFNATCLSDNISRLTALTNDYGWEYAYTRQLKHLTFNDILITISVHGGSPKWSGNLVRATQFARSVGARTLSLIGHDGGELGKYSDFSIIVPSESTPIIEGIHCVLTHVVRQKLEEMKKCNK